MLDEWREYLVSVRGISEASITRFRLRYDSGHGGIYIPYINKLGEEYGHTIRLLDPGARPKYLRESGFEQSLYNVSDLYESPLYITEGEIDCISVSQEGFRCVGVHGTEAFRESWRWGFVGAEVVICADGDEPGRRAALKIKRILRGTTTSTRILEFPEGEDCNSLLKKGELKSWLTDF